MNETGDMLKGWKAIADYFQSNERTVRRWQGLPVRKVGGSIYTTRRELEEWVKSGGRSAVAVEEKAAEPEAPPLTSRTPGGKGRSVAAVVFLLLLLAVAVGLSRNGRATRSATPVMTAGRALAMIAHARVAETGGTPMGGFLSSLTGELFLFFRERRGFAVFDRNTLRKTYTHAEPLQVEFFTNRDGHRYAYFTRTDPPAVYRLDLQTKTVSRFWSNGEQPFSLALTPDGRYLFIGVKPKQIVRIETGTMDEVRYPVDGHPKTIVFAKLEGREQLWVAHQGYGRIGSFGADAVETIDPWTGKSLRDSFHSPHVGGALAVLPRVERIWLDGNDVCLRPHYSWKGCPHSPGSILHVLRPDHSEVFRIGFPSNDGAMPFPSPDESKVLVTSGGTLRTLDSRSGQTIEFADMKAAQALWAPDGSVLYVPTSDRKLYELPVLPESCAAGLESAMHVWNGDGHAQDSFSIAHLTLQRGVGFGPGLLGQAFHFAGNGSASADGSNVHALMRLGGMLSFFVRREDAKNEQGIMDWLDSNGNRLLISVTADGVLVFELLRADGQRGMLRTKAHLAVESWHHAALSLEEKEWKKPLIASLFLDGELQGQFEAPTMPAKSVTATKAIFSLGMSRSMVGFSGSLDEITVHTTPVKESALRSYNRSLLGETCAQQTLQKLGRRREGSH